MINNYKKILIFCLLLVCYGLAHAQVNVTGVVKGSDDGKTLPGVSVVVKGDKRGASTGLNGEFKISVPANAVLKFSFIGYVTKEVEVNGKTFINVTLQASQNSLNDVVVVGYHDVKQKLTTAAITVISGKDIEDLPAASFATALQGKVSGVNIQNFSGSPGVPNTFVVRGNSNLAPGLNDANALSSPLYIIDGVPTSISDLGNYDNTGTDVLAGININDIESIQVAKDAAATAIWGSRGANGVVTIITKKAKKGKPQVSLNVYGGFSNQPKLVQTATGSFERSQKIGLLSQTGGYNAVGTLPQMLTDSLNPAFNNATDWQGLFYRKAYLHNVDFSIAGATDALNYRFSLNNYSEDGVVYGTGFKRYAFRSNISYQVTDKLGSEINFSFSRSDRAPGLTQYASDPNYTTPLSGSNLPSSLYYVSPTDKAGFRGDYDELRNAARNDLLTGFIGLHYNILPGLIYKVEGTGSINTTERQYSIPSTLNTTNFSEYDNSNYVTLLVNNILSYSKKIGQNNNLNFLVLQSFQRDAVTSVDISGDNLPSDNIKVVQGTPQASLGGSSDYQATSLLSYATQVHYDYKEKYLFDATFRADASSRFGADHKWGYFPSASVGYIISDEAFLKPITWISQLKLRASYGVSGDLPTSFYAPYNTYNVSQGTYNGVPIATPNFNTGTGVTDTKLTWESTRQTDIGFDAQFLNNRISLTFDYYNKIQDHKYFTFALPFYTGYTQQTSNSPLSVGNRGIEVNIDTHNLAPTSKFQWTTNFNFSYNNNKVLALPNGNRTLYGYNNGQSFVIEVGKPLFNILQLVYQGVYNTVGQIPVNPYTGAPITYFKGGVAVKPGAPIWKDINQLYDVWTDENNGSPQGDQAVAGNPNPSITGGFNNNFSYKNWSLSIGTTFTLKRDIVNTLLANQFDNWATNAYDFTNSSIPNLSTLGFWNAALAAQNPNGYKAKYPLLNPNAYYYYQFRSFGGEYNENGAYFKVTNISVGYKVPKRYLDALKISGCRFYATLDNVLTIQKATVPDVENVSPYGLYTGNAYPIPKKYTLGVTVQL